MCHCNNCLGDWSGDFQNFRNSLSFSSSYLSSPNILVSINFSINYSPKRWKWSSQKKLFKLICNGCPIGAITFHFVLLVFVHWFDIVNNRLKSLLAKWTFSFDLWFEKETAFRILSSNTNIHSAFRVYLWPLQQTTKAKCVQTSVK